MKLVEAVAAMEPQEEELSALLPVSFPPQPSDSSWIWIMYGALHPYVAACLQFFLLTTKKNN